MESVTSIDDYDNTVRPMDRSITSLAEEKSVSQLMKVLIFTLIFTSFD